MRLSRDKINVLSHAVADKLASVDEIEFIEDRNTIRLAVFELLHTWLKKEETIDAGARKMVVSQSRKIPEGSSEWEVLYRKYYEEALRDITE
ncbi:MAG TPA: DUF507 family protein [Terriglobia bacterium]|nr:DUF507 family protein [Terriglobia bacterium]